MLIDMVEVNTVIKHLGKTLLVNGKQGPYDINPGKKKSPKQMWITSTNLETGDNEVYYIPMEEKLEVVENWQEQHPLLDKFNKMSITGLSKVVPYMKLRIEFFVLDELGKTLDVSKWFEKHTETSNRNYTSPGVGEDGRMFITTTFTHCFGWLMDSVYVGLKAAYDTIKLKYKKDFSIVFMDGDKQAECVMYFYTTNNTAKELGGVAAKSELATKNIDTLATSLFLSLTSPFITKLYKDSTGLIKSKDVHSNASYGSYIVWEYNRIPAVFLFHPALANFILDMARNCFSLAWIDKEVVASDELRANVLLGNVDAARQIIQDNADLIFTCLKYSYASYIAVKTSLSLITDSIFRLIKTTSVIANYRLEHKQDNQWINHCGAPGLNWSSTCKILYTKQGKI